MIETNDRGLLDRWYDMIEKNELGGSKATYSGQDFRTPDGRTTVYSVEVYFVENILDGLDVYVVEMIRKHSNWTETLEVNFFDTEYEAKRCALELLWYQI